MDGCIRRDVRYKINDDMNSQAAENDDIEGQ